MKKLPLLLFIFFSLSIKTGYANNCPTHLSCQMGMMCGCTIPPSSAFDRYFYFDFSDIAKSHYLCHFTSRLGRAVLLLMESTFPDGVTYQMNGNNHFPVDVMVDTTKMVVQNNNRIIFKYLVSAGDYPTEVQAICTPA